MGIQVYSGCGCVHVCHIGMMDIQVYSGGACVCVSAHVCMHVP